MKISKKLYSVLKIAVFVLTAACIGLTIMHMVANDTDHPEKGKTLFQAISNNDKDKDNNSSSSRNNPNVSSAPQEEIPSVPSLIDLDKSMESLDRFSEDEANFDEAKFQEKMNKVNEFVNTELVSLLNGRTTDPDGSPITPLDDGSERYWFSSWWTYPDVPDDVCLTLSELSHTNWEESWVFNRLDERSYWLCDEDLRIDRETMKETRQYYEDNYDRLKAEADAINGVSPAVSEPEVNDSND